jgi:CDP-diacylglycerol--glycerol-3-phosphate 3-phosphatidyltransferase
VRITANQVTMARIFLLPVPVYMLIYGQALQWWIAFAIFVLLGATDFVDGLMARKEGPTKLGSLIDPVADKIFVAAIMLSMVAIDIFPAWMVSALLSREFLMTALRSSVAIRKETFKTSRLAKLKTIIQMGGCGTIFFTIVLPEQAYIYVCVALGVPFLLVWAVYRWKSHKPPFWAMPVGLAFLLVSAVEYFFQKDVTLMLQMLIILAITWASAIYYLIGSYKLFRRTGMRFGDWIRMLWAIVFGLLVPPLVAYFPIIVLPVLVSMSLEFGLGGIDNIVVTEKHHFSSWPFLISLSAGIIFITLMSLAIMVYTQLPAFYFALALAMTSSIVCGAFFGRHFDLFKRNLS